MEVGHINIFWSLSPHGVHFDKGTASRPQFPCWDLVLKAGYVMVGRHAPGSVPTVDVSYIDHGQERSVSLARGGEGGGGVNNLGWPLGYLNIFPNWFHKDPKY